MNEIIANSPDHNLLIEATEMMAIRLLLLQALLGSLGNGQETSIVCINPNYIVIQYIVAKIQGESLQVSCSPPSCLHRAWATPVWYDVAKGFPPYLLHQRGQRL